MKQRPNYTNTQRNRKYLSPYKEDFWLAIAFTIIIAAPLFFLLKIPLYVSYMLGINIVNFGVYGYDKYLARKKGWRVPELVLHWLAILGGAFGGIIGMWVFRHKIRKQIFHIILWSSLIFHSILFIVFFRVLLIYNGPSRLF